MTTKIKEIIMQATSEELEFDLAIKQLESIDPTIASEYAKGGLEYAITSGILTIQECEGLCFDISTVYDCLVGIVENYVSQGGEILC